MNKDFDQFDKDFKALVESYEPSYSGNSWKRLEGELPKSKGYFWYYFAASVFVLAIASLFIPHNNSSEKENLEGNLPKEYKQSHNISQEQIVKLEEEELILDNTLPVVQNNYIEVAEQKEKSLVLNEEKEDVVIHDKEEKATQDILDKESKLTQNISSDICDKNKEIISTAKPEVIFDKTEGCAPLSVSAVLKGVPASYDIKWIYKGETLSTVCQFAQIFDKEGGHLIELRVSDENGHSYYSQDYKIDVFAVPYADYTIEEEDGLLVIESMSKNYDQLTWNFSGIETQEENPTFEMLYSDTYTLKLRLSNSNSCATEVSEQIVYKENHHVFAPTAFSPDGDGVNDEFMVKYRKKEGYKYRLQVFNSAGKMLFESSEAQPSWKGDLDAVEKQTHNQKYLWRLIVEDPRGYAVTKEGVFFQL